MEFTFWMLSSLTMMNAERRRFPRHALSLPITCVLPGKTEKEPLHATSINVSLNGMYCRVNRYIPLFEKLLITFLHPTHDGKPNEIVLQSEGVVVRVEPEDEQAGQTEYAVAFYFPALTEQQHGTLQDLIDAHTEIVA